MATIMTLWKRECPTELSSVLDGEIACVDDSGRPMFRDLLFRQRQCVYIACAAAVTYVVVQKKRPRRREMSAHADTDFLELQA